MLSAFNLERFMVKTMSADEWINGFIKFHIKFHDGNGFFGAEQFDFFTYSSKKEVGKFGLSKAYIMLHNKRSLQHMKDSIFESIDKRMEELGVDVKEVIDRNLVIYAYDPYGGSVIGRGGINIQFPSYNRRKNDGKNAKQIRKLERCTGQREGEKSEGA